MNNGRHVDVTPDWQRWIVEAIDGGSAPAELLATMRDNGFDEGIARRAIADVVFGGPSPDRPEEYVSPRYRERGSRLSPQHVIHAVDRDVRVLLRVARPVIAVLDNVLDAGECAALCAMASARLARSAVVAPESGTNTVMDIRTSEGAYFHRAENELIHRIDVRAAAIMGLSEEHGEGLQVMRYGVGGEYVPHYDFFPPNEKGSERHLQSGGQRVSTLIMYLNDADDGGETIFPHIDLHYIPKKGQALYFEYASASGELDSLSLHGGAPVRRGEKWIVTKWMRERAFAG
ncbi:prolyl 4-hydroxylase [Luteibacter rhizovicinus]|uniref:Prolyl 4-hydroxylase n=1 Tax=Luteibacter rhizovicinus TaxID=242606 RepID=A0A4R3YQ00_9GAMM|nr:2OG-Fe(II) oxygenase [Luteibacter rhizovicinus]TCV94857.1 prolyl 4-hydroxylase [Luteibacter rhizovicinus]